jgi:hypothetical protein
VEAAQQLSRRALMGAEMAEGMGKPTNSRLARLGHSAPRL